MILSEETYQGLKLLTLKAISIYEKYLNSQFYQEARFDWTIDKEGNFLRKKEQAENEIKSLPEYSTIATLFSNEYKIKPLIDKSIGTEAGMIHFIPENFILTFISSFYSNNILLNNEETFSKYFEEVENFLFGNTIEESYWVLLLNFEYEGSEIVFSDDLRIRRLSDIELIKGRVNTNRGLDHIKYFFPDTSHSFFMIEKLFKHDKKVIDEKKIFSGGSRQNKSKILEDFINVVKSLRVLKSSDVHINEIFHSEFKKFYPTGCKSSSYNNLKRHMTTLFLDLKKLEIELLHKIYNTIKQENNEFKVPINRLYFSKDRNDNEDKLIDLIIGLESIYRSSGSMHLGLRCGLTLADDKRKAHDIYMFVDKMRQLRNQIVHGSSFKKTKNNLSKENIEILENYLRSSILLKINEPDKFKSDSKSWNDIYFK